MQSCDTQYSLTCGQTSSLLSIQRYWAATQIYVRMYNTTNTKDTVDMEEDMVTTLQGTQESVAIILSATFIIVVLVFITMYN